MIKKGDKYICELCNREFVADKDYEEALLEEVKKHGELEEDDQGYLVCDECYRIIERWERMKKSTS